ncbi:MAG: signal peptide peptidase SppA [Acidobacteriota bacterium]|jgi:protease IV
MARKRYYSKIVLSEEIRETPPAFGWLGRKRQTLLRDLLRALDALAKHPRVDTVLLVIRTLSAGWGQVEEIRGAMQRVRKAGKHCIVCLESADNRSIYLASAADAVYLLPASTFELIGLRVENFFLKDLLDELGIRAELLHVGAYKSAGEMFTRTEMSEASREMVQAILADLQDRLVKAVAEGCGLSEAKVRELLDGGPLTAQQAVEQGLAKGLAYESELDERLRGKPNGLTAISVKRLIRKEGFLRRRLHPRRPEIAYLVAEGMIVHGPSRRSPGRWSILDSRNLVELIQAVRRRRRVKAVVVRVRSPGGSGLASDLIWHELQRLNQDKPVIISFSDVAASGGYYLATAGRYIFANPSTLTGSIGVLGGKFSAGPLIERLKVKVDTVELGAQAGYASVTRPFTSSEADNLQQHLEDFYERLFLPKVAECRRTEVDRIREVAEGRVWTGAQAREVGLIDALGGMDEAFEEARRQANLTAGRFRIVTPAPRRSLLDLVRLVLPIGMARERLLALWQDFEIR